MTLARRLDAIVGYVLLGGVVLSLALITVGVAWHRATSGDFRFDYQLGGTSVFQFIAEDVRELVRGAVRPRLFLNLGIAALLLTPYARVLASLVYFAAVERNPKYVVFTGIVLGTLTYTLFAR